MEKQSRIENPPRRFGCLQVAGLMLLTAVVTLLVAVWVVRNYLFVSQFTPVTLSAQEERALQAKLRRLDVLEAAERPAGSSKENAAEAGPLEPEPYSEKGAKREIEFTERELNALLAKNTDLAHKLAVDLADDLVSIKLRLPLDEDFPVLGGKTLRLKAGAEFAYRDGRPVVILKGVTIMGVPVPNAWLGGLKNIDLVAEFGTDEGFWKSFSEGVADIRVEEGRLRIKLKE